MRSRPIRVAQRRISANGSPVNYVAERVTEARPDEVEPVILTEFEYKILEALEIRPALDLIDLASSAQITPQEARLGVRVLEKVGLVVDRQSWLERGLGTKAQEGYELDKRALHEHVELISRAGL